MTEDRRRFEVRLVSHIMAGLHITALSGAGCCNTLHTDRTTQTAPG